MNLDFREQRLENCVSEFISSTFHEKESKPKHELVCKQELQGIDNSDMKNFLGLEKQLLHNLKSKR